MDWEVFQTDVLDVLKQYEGYFDFFERVGSLSDDSRPDFLARITRNEKKEVWVLDAKKKPEIDQEDRQRMERYLEMIDSNPIDVGLDSTELPDHDIRGIFVTSRDSVAEEYESVEFSSLHQFLQKELVYTDTDRVVRNVSKMMERQQLSQGQARTLFRSLRPYQKSYSQGRELLKDMGSKYIDLDMKEQPFDLLNNPPVDSMLYHSERDAIFLFDIPYSREAVNSIDDKAEQIEEIVGEREKCFYAGINTFESHESDYAVKPEKVEELVRKKAGILPPEAVLELFEPNIRTRREYSDGRIVVESDIDFKMVLESSSDTRHRLEMKLPERAANQLKNNLMNSRTDFGEVKDSTFRLDLEILEGMEVETPEKLDFEDFRHKVQSIYRSSINPVLGKKVSRKIE